MKGSVLIVVCLVIAVGAGFGGGFAAATLHNPSGNVATNQVPTITGFKLLRPVIENGSGLGVTDTYQLNATEGNVPYEAGFQIVMFEHNQSLTLSSGSFYGSLNYTPISFLKYFEFSGLPPGNYTLVATVMHGSLSDSTNANLTVLPHVEATVSGSHNVNDSSGATSTVFYAHATAGKGHYSYSWSIINDSYSQEASFVSNTSASFQVTFYYNQTDAYFFGYNGTMYIQLTVTDSLGYQFSLAYPGYQVNLTGN
jgi:hypothetical protein